MIDADILRSLLEYNPDTGVFTWRVTRGGAARKGDFAGCLNSNGYRIIMVNGRFYRAHRLAWLYTHGVWPCGEADHINNIRDDNRICNIREATRSQNLANTRKHKGDLPKGVTSHRRKFKAQLTVAGKRMFLGMFDTPELAHAAYCEAAQKAFGAYHRAG